VKMTRNEYYREYHQLSEVKERNKLYLQSPVRKEWEHQNKERLKEYSVEYWQRPEVKERERVRTQSVKRKEWRREYTHRPEVIERRRALQREYYHRPEVKARVTKQRNSEEAKEKVRARIFNTRLSGTKSHVKKRGLEWGLADDMALQLMNRPCHYCGGVDTVYKRNICGIDRVDNSKGYIEGNVVPCCKDCNYKKSAVTVDIARKIVEFVNAKKE